MIKYYQCLTCRAFFLNLVKIDKHLEICNAADLDSSNYNRGRRPVRAVTFTDCYIPIVRNQIDPEFLKLYDGVEAKSDEENEVNSTNLESVNKSTRSNEKRKRAKLSKSKGSRSKSIAINQVVSLEGTQNLQNIKRKSSTLRKCSECDKHFFLKRELELHEKIVHRQDYDITRQCIFCQKMFINYRDLEIHVRGHILERPFFCKICNRELNTIDGCRAHEKTHDPNRELSFECDLCGKKFFSQANLTQHLIFHKGERPFQCDICDRRFRCGRDKRSHMETHKTERERKVSCEICEKRFYNMDGLKNHMVTHSDLRPVPCELCDKMFKTTDTLRSHMATHGKRKRDFKCHLCPKKFFNNCTLRGHLQIHTGKRPHKCPVCGMAFTTARGARRHKSVVHDGIKPFKCSDCGLRFALKHNWISHTKNHRKCSKATCIILNENGDEENKPKIMEIKSLKIKKENVKTEKEEEDDDSSISNFSDPFMMVTDVKMEFPTLNSEM